MNVNVPNGTVASHKRAYEAVQAWRAKTGPWSDVMKEVALWKFQEPLPPDAEDIAKMVEKMWQMIEKVEDLAKRVDDLTRPRR